MTQENPIIEPTTGPPRDGIAVLAVRGLVRAVVVVLVLPVRMAWDALAAARRRVDRTAVRPVGRALRWVGRVVFARPLVALGRHVLRPVGAWLLRVTRPVGRGLATVVSRLGGGVGACARWLYRQALTPAGRGLAWLARYLVAVPAMAVHQYLLTPIGHGLRWTVDHVLGPVAGAVASVLTWAWPVATRISRAVGRGIAAVARTVTRPLRRAYRATLAPLGHALRRASRDVGRIVRQTRAEVRALFGGPRSGADEATMDR